MEITVGPEEELAFLRYWDELCIRLQGYCCSFCGYLISNTEVGFEDDDIILCESCYKNIQLRYREYRELRMRYERAITNLVFSLVKIGGLESKDAKAIAFDVIATVMSGYILELKAASIRPEILFTGWMNALTGMLYGSQASMSDGERARIVRNIAASLKNPDETVLAAMTL